MIRLFLRKLLAVTLVSVVSSSGLPVQAMMAKSSRIEVAAVAGASVRTAVAAPLSPLTATPAIAAPLSPLTATPAAAAPGVEAHAVPVGQASAMPQREVIEPLIDEAVSETASLEASRDSAAAMWGEGGIQKSAQASVVVPENGTKSSPRRISLGRRLALGTVALAGSMAVALPVAVAQAETLAAQTEGLPASVKWGAGIAGFVGFLLGSIPNGDAARFDVSRAVVGALVGVMIGGGVAFALVTGQFLWGVPVAGVGALIGYLRWGTLPKPTPVVMTSDLMTFEGTAAEKVQKAKHAFARLAIPTPRNPKRGPAPRGRTYYYGANGMTADHVQDLLSVPHDNLDYSPFALLLRSLPHRPGEPGIVLVKDPAILSNYFGSRNKLPVSERKLRVSDDGNIVADGRVVANVKNVAGLTFFHSRHPVRD